MAKGTEQVEIVRDTWGVPHVFAKSEPGALYGQGYAMAEDRLPTMMRSYRKAVGQMAEVFGPDWTEHDHQQRIWRHAQVARAHYLELPASWWRAAEAFVEGIEPWREALYAAYEARTGDKASPDAGNWQRLGEAIEALRAWDGRADVESVGMTLFRSWWSALEPVRDAELRQTIEEGKALSGQAQDSLLAALDKAARSLSRRFGGLHVPWGRVYRTQRGDRSWAVSGISGRDGLIALRAISSGAPDDDGISYARGGPACTTVVMLKPGDVRSYSVVPYGQSEDPTSPHYTDQGRMLFSKGMLKDTWFSRERRRDT